MNKCYFCNQASMRMLTGVLYNRNMVYACHNCHAAIKEGTKIYQKNHPQSDEKKNFGKNSPGGNT